MTVSGTAEALWALIEPYLAKEGIELDDLEIAGGSGASIVRVTIDADEAIDVERVARVSRGVSRLLDDADPFVGSYTLEISSPGLERRLRRQRHYEKSLGREVKVKTRSPIEGERLHRGVLVAATDEDATVETADGSHSIPYAEITSARTVFVWEAKAKPGAAKH